MLSNHWTFHCKCDGSMRNFKFANVSSESNQCEWKFFKTRTKCFRFAVQEMEEFRSHTRSTAVRKSLKIVLEFRFEKPFERSETCPPSRCAGLISVAWHHLWSLQIDIGATTITTAACYRQRIQFRPFRQPSPPWPRPCTLHTFRHQPQKTPGSWTQLTRRFSIFFALCPPSVSLSPVFHAQSSPTRRSLKAIPSKKKSLPANPRFIRPLFFHPLSLILSRWNLIDPCQSIERRTKG